MTNKTPFEAGVFGAPLYLDASTTEASSMMWMVTPEYFDTMGIRLLQGRAFSAFDRQGTPGAAVIDQAFARRYFGDANPLGHRITSPILGDVEWTIVGIVGLGALHRACHGSLRQACICPSPSSRRSGSRKRFAPSASSRGSKAILPRWPPPFDPSQRLWTRRCRVRDFRTMEEAIDTWSIREPRFRTMLLTAFGGFALLLAAVGVYGNRARTPGVGDGWKSLHGISDSHFGCCGGAPVGQR